MDKRLEKRHKRQVSRAKNKGKVSEPDVRTHEQIEAAREASRPDLSRGNNAKLNAPVSSRGGQNRAGSAAKTDA